MDEKEYLSYGMLQVEKQALLNKMADHVAMYVDKLPWSRKKKARFITAYTDLVKRGIIGANNDTGQWLIEVNGDDLNVDALPKREKRMYLEAAWFIRHQMKSLALDKEIDKKEEETSKTPIDFANDFKKYVSRLRFGGTDFTTSLWNEFDLRDKYGIRGTGNRTKILSGLLDSYSNTITDDKYDFKDSAFENATDLKNRIAAARAALETPDKQDDLETFYAIGLDPKDWFNNGSGDPSGYTTSDGLELTYSQYNDYLELQEKLRLRNELNKKIKLYKLKKQHLDLILNSVNEVNKVRDKLTKGVSPTLGETGFTDADKLELGALIGDIASIVYPGAVGGAILGTASASARTAASAMRGDLNFWDRLVDHATGIIGGFPLFGDAVMLGKVGKGVRAFIQGHGLLEALNNTPELSAVGRKIVNGDWSDITVDEWKGMLKFFRGLTGAGRVFKSNQSLASAAKRSGLEVENGWLRKLSGLGPKISGNRNYSVKVKVGDKDVDVKLELSEYDNLVNGLRKVKPTKKGKEEGLNLVKQSVINKPEVKAAKPDVKAEDITVLYSPTWRNYVPFFRENGITSSSGITRSSLIGNTQAEFEASLKNRGFWDKVANGSNRALREYRLRFRLLENLLNNPSSGLANNPSTNPAASGSSTNSYIPEGIDLKTLLKLNNAFNVPESKLHKLVREILPSKTKLPDGTVKYGPAVVKGKKLIDGSEFEVSYTGGKIGEQKMTVIYKGQPIDIEGKTLGLQKQNLGKWINEQNVRILSQTGNLILKSDDSKSKDFVNGVLELKRLGFLYEKGGRIDKLKIQKYKEYILK